ncbi:unnamed protein product, partial [Adineta steineri]
MFHNHFRDLTLVLQTPNIENNQSLNSNIYSNVKFYQSYTSASRASNNKNYLYNHSSLCIKDKVISI